MKLKKQKRDEQYDQAACAASGCKRKASIGIAPGVKFPAELGTVPLCDAHHEKLTDEDEAAAPAAKATPAALIPSPAVQAELETEATEAKETLALIEEFKIENQGDYDFANEALGDVKGKLKALDSKQKSVTKPLNDVLKEVRSWFKPAKDFYAKAEILWKGKISEAHRKAEEAQDRALREVQEAHEQGDAEGVRQALVSSQVAEIQQAANISRVMSWDFEIEDEGKIPRQYMVPDVQAIGKVVKALGEKAGIPGVRVFEKETIVRRGA